MGVLDLQWHAAAAGRQPQPGGLAGTLLNLLLALPVYAVVTDLAQWVYPEEVEV